ncbi:recombinase family protein [Halomicrobium urmianum]|uniref:recombinase family protein n=1 Tax=Halomicrobium urmianum TaxID=1586233 RepID=UPI001CD96CB4|nr:recombinase family protein [Halomicrobium urmianum]
MPLPKTLIYIRTDVNDSTEQLADTIEYVRDRLVEIPTEATQPPFDRNTYETLRDTANVTWTGDDEETYPEKLEAELRKARDEQYDHIIVPHLYTLSESLRDVHKTIDSLHAAGVSVHVASRRVALKPTNSRLRSLLADCAEFERKDNARNLDPITAGERHKGGRPPAGYVVENGYRRPGPEYDKVEATLHEVVNGKMSIHRAAARLNVSRTTIRNAVEKRPELYDLPEDAALPSQ